MPTHLAIVCTYRWNPDSMGIFFAQHQRKIYHSPDPSHYITVSKEILLLSAACSIHDLFVHPSLRGSGGGCKKQFLLLPA